MLLSRDVALGQGALSAALQAMMRGAAPQDAAREVEAAWARGEDALLADATASGAETEAAAARCRAARRDREAARAAALQGAFAVLGLRLAPGGKVQLADPRAADLTPDFDALFADPPESPDPPGLEANGAAGDVREADAYRRARGHVLEAASTVFSDAEEDFASLARVKRRMEEWKAAFPKAYRDVYFPDSAAALFSPFVRSELLFWEPLFHELAPAHGAAAAPSQPCVAAFDALPWFELLFDYGLALDEKFPEKKVADPGAAEDDEDANLLPKIVEKVVLPWALHAAERCFDPASTRQATRIVQLLTDLLVYVDPVTSEGLQATLRALSKRITEEAAAIALPAWPFGAVELAPALLLATGLRAFLRAARLLRSACSLLRPMLGFEDLRGSILQDLLGKKVVPYLRSMMSGPQLGWTLLPTFLEMITRALEGLAAPGTTLMSAFPEEIKLLCDTAVAGAKAMAGPGAGGAHAACLVPVDARGRRICRVLLALGDREGAVVVAQLLGIQLPTVVE